MEGTKKLEMSFHHVQPKLMTCSDFYTIRLTSAPLTMIAFLSRDELAQLGREIAVEIGVPEIPRGEVVNDYSVVKDGETEATIGETPMAPILDGTPEMPPSEPLFVRDPPPGTPDTQIDPDIPF
jgi:hypothetical protein